MNYTGEPFESRASRAGLGAQQASAQAEIPDVPGVHQRASRQRQRGLVLAVGLLAAAVVALFAAAPNLRNDAMTPPSAQSALTGFGVASGAAGCSAPTVDRPGSSAANHTDPGVRISYDVIPPSYGKHWPQVVEPAKAFYTESDRPPLEQLVHNLEHGYTILWYDSTIEGDQLEELQGISKLARAKETVRDRFIVSAWDDSYGKFPEGKHLALSHWGADAGHRQFCEKVSGDAVESFIAKYPASDAPEPFILNDRAPTPADSGVVRASGVDDTGRQ